MPSPRAAQELDLLLQEGRADDPALLEGLVHLYANDLFRFAWENLAETDNPTIRRLRTRRAVTQALLTALTHLHRFQEQPSTFLWLLRLTRENAPRPPADLPQQVAFLARTYTNSPEDLAYILKIPERHPALKALDPAQPPAPPTPAPGSADRPAAFTPLTPAEVAALIEQIRSAQVPVRRAASLPRFTREFVLLGVILLFVIQFVRNTPNRVVYLPTPLPPPTATPSPWDLTPVPLPTVVRPAGHVFYENPNPYLVWQMVRFVPNAPVILLSMAASPTEPLLAVGDNLDQVILWDLTTFTQTLTLKGHTNDVHSLAFSPDGHLLASGDGDGLVQLWEMPSGTLLQQFVGHPKMISALAFSPDGQTLLVASGEELWVWGVNNGVRLALYTSFDEALTEVVVSPDGAYWAVGLGNGTGILVRARDAFPLVSFEIKLGGYGRTMMFSPDGKYLVVLSRENQPMILRFNQTTGTLSPEIFKKLLDAGEDSYAPSVQDFMFSPNGRILAAVDGGTVYLWDTQTWTTLQAPFWMGDYNGTNHYLAFSFDSAMMILNRSDGKFAVWTLNDLSTEEGRTLTPQYFERYAHDFMDWTYVIPEEETTIWGQTNLATIARVSESVGFTVKVPLVGVLGGDHEFQTLDYDSDSEIVFASVWASDQPGIISGFNLQESKLKGDELMIYPDSPLAVLDLIGLTALVKPVQIGSLTGEMISGGWTYVDEENFEVWNQTFEPGDRVRYIMRWSENPGSVSLRWAEEDILFELKAYTDSGILDQMGATPEKFEDTLVLLAQTMYAPEEVSLPWNIPPYFYKVATGDTCARLAERFYTSVQTIRALNGLGDTCILPAGQTLLLPAPAEPFATTDLNCDRREETVLLLHDPTAPARISGVALEVSTSENVRSWAWKYSAEEMGVDSLNPPEIFTLEDAPNTACEQFLILTGGLPTASQTRIFQWDGEDVASVLAEAGRPYSSDYSVAALLQTSGGTFIIPLIQYVPATLPSLGPCPNQVTTYTWNGIQFRAGETQTVSGECAGN